MILFLILQSTKIDKSAYQQVWSNHPASTLIILTLEPRSDFMVMEGWILSQTRMDEKKLKEVDNLYKDFETPEAASNVYVFLLMLY